MLTYIVSNIFIYGSVFSNLYISMSYSVTVDGICFHILSISGVVRYNVTLTGNAEHRQARLLSCCCKFNNDSVFCHKGVKEQLFEWI